MEAEVSGIVGAEKNAHNASRSDYRPRRLDSPRPHRRFGHLRKDVVADVVHRAVYTSHGNLSILEFLKSKLIAPPARAISLLSKLNQLRLSCKFKGCQKKTIEGSFVVMRSQTHRAAVSRSKMAKRLAGGLRRSYFAALAARMASVSMGATLNRSPQMP